MNQNIENFQIQKQDIEKALKGLIKTTELTLIPTGFIILKKIAIISDRNSFVPRVYISSFIEGNSEISILKNVLDNYSKILELVKRYTILYTSIVGSKNYLLYNELNIESSLDITRILEDKILNNSINGYKEVIFENDNIRFELECLNFGSERKYVVTNQYIVYNKQNDTTVYTQYTVDKTEFISDWMYQIINQLPIHIKI